MKKVYIFILIILMFFTGCSKTNVHNNLDKNTYTQSDETNEDIEKRYRDLETVWDNLNLKYRFENEYSSPDITFEEFESYKEELKARIPSIKSDMEFYCELKILISKLQDGHLDISFDYDTLKDELNFLPMELRKLEDMWILTGVYKEYEKYLGYELISINDRPIEDVYNMFLDIISYENLYWVDVRFPLYVTMIDILDYLDIVNNGEDEVKLTLRDVENDKIVETDFMTVKVMDYYKMDNYTYIVSIEERMVSTNYDSYDLTEDVYMIELRSCRKDSNYNIIDFQNKVIADIKEKKHKKVIIDLRYNEGGLSGTFEMLINELGRLQESQKFDSYTLIGNDTFSSGVATAAHINNKLINTLYGSPTGGKPNSYGATEYKELESPFKLYKTYMYYRCTPYDDMMTLYPDITVEQTYEDYKNKVDTVVEEVLLRK